MYTKYDLVEWLLKALRKNGNEGTIVELCKIIWEYHENDLKNAGNLFYTWQYDVRWAADELRERRIMRSAQQSPRGVWQLAP